MSTVVLPYAVRRRWHRRWHVPVWWREAGWVAACEIILPLDALAMAAPRGKRTVRLCGRCRNALGLQRPRPARQAEGQRRLWR